MTAPSTLARAALAWVFVFSGQDVMRHPQKPAKTAGPLLDTMRRAAPIALPDDETIVRANAAVQAAGGVALAAGITPRFSAAVLAATLVPTTLGGHAFWTHEDPAQRANQRNHFNKNLGLLGGLLAVVLAGEKGSRDSDNES
jgi:putative oxidoreductase